MKIIQFSKDVVLTENPTTDPIYLFTQFFIHRDATRNSEIQECLRKNVNNSAITTIYLLNERIYTDAEMGIERNKNRAKIVQTVINRRLKYQDFFKYIRENSLKGYAILANSDIFLNDSIARLRTTDIHLTKKIFALLRFEYNKADITKSPIFGPRFDSQDTWIIHTDQTVPESSEKIFNFELGKPGCDNKLLYLMNILAYEIINDPTFILTFHYHTAQYRDYSQKDIIIPPWTFCVPGKMDISFIAPSVGVDLKACALTTRNFKDMTFDDNTKIYDYVLSKVSENKNFILPRISGIENNFAAFARISRNKGSVSPEVVQYFQKVAPFMKNNAGIKLTSMASIVKYSDMYLKAFDQCDLYCGWESHGEYINHIAQSHEYMKQTYSAKQIIMSFSLDIFHYIYAKPWTLALRGKRILMISPFETSIQEKIPIREKIYGIDLFPECEILTIKPPQTQAGEDSREFDLELADFTKKLDEIKDTYDVALVSAGGYGNPICSHIFASGKSAVYVGGVLQMYWGILGSRWLKERPDAVRLFLNEHWSRPKIEERPKGCENVEKGCYW